jgi:hypothetical protein
MSDTLKDVDEADEVVYNENSVCSQEEWLAELAANGEDNRQFDPRYVCLRRVRRGDLLDNEPAVYAKKATLGHVTRIEKIRWQTQLNLHRFWDRRADLCKEVLDAGGECFIPVGAPSLYNAKGRMAAEYPRRVVVEKSRDYDGLSTHYDDDYWTFRPTKHNGTEMEVVAEAIEHGEWEQVILPKRIADIVSPPKAALGRRWRHMECRERRLREHCELLNEMLKLAIQFTGLLPRGHNLVERDVIIEINGRRYPFSVRGDYPNSEDRKWPRPDDIPDVIVPDSFALDETLVGVSADAVRTRLGEPATIKEMGNKHVWRYPEGTVFFTKVGGWPPKVNSVDLTPNDIQAAPVGPTRVGRTNGRAVQGSSQGRTGGRARSKARPARRQGVAGEEAARGKAKGTRARQAGKAS